MPPSERSTALYMTTGRYFLLTAKASSFPGVISPVISIDLAVTIVPALCEMYSTLFVRTAVTSFAANG